MAANLALAFSRAGRRVVVVDGSDGRELLGISGHDGTPAFLRKARPVRAGDLTLDRFRMQGSTVVVVRPRPGAKTLDEKTASDAIRSLLTEADVVVVTASTGGGSPNSLVWSRAADATLLVADSGRTRRDEIPLALETLRIVKANVIGAVLARDNLF
jgi:Mrp family chromosome partitioning ATPase